MKKIIISVLLCSILVVMLALPVAAARSFEQTEIFCVDRTYTAEEEDYAYKGAYPDTFCPMMSNTVFRFTFRNVEMHRFLWSIWENDEGSSLFIDYYRSYGATDGSVHLGYWSVGAQKNIFFGELVVPAGATVREIVFRVSNDVGSLSDAQILPGEVFVWIEAKDGSVTVSPLTALEVSAADQEIFSNFRADKAYVNGMNMEYDMPFSNPYHVRSDYGSVDVTVRAGVDPLASKMIAGLHAAHEAELARVEQEKQQLQEEKNALESEKSALESEKSALEEQNKTLQAERDRLKETVDNMNKITNDGEKGVVAGFIDTLGSKLIEAMAYLLDGVSLFGITLRSVVATLLVLAIIGVIVVVVIKLV